MFMEIITAIVCLAGVYYHTVYKYDIVLPECSYVRFDANSFSKYTAVSCLAKAHYLNHQHSAKSIPIIVLAHARHLEVCNGA